ncbi:MAG TPA: enoyl-CoA hydratase-related protein, partial [Rhabdaerophilum sp.]|nr:enoyl-CoA hydratase-related protein [Rhabdaerophilum sp.]
LPPRLKPEWKHMRTYHDQLPYEDGDPPSSNQGFHCGALLAEPLSAEKAETWGLIWKCIDDEALLAEAKALTAHLATQPTGALAAIKAAIHKAATGTLDVQLDHERDEQRRLGFSDDYAEGVAAFMEKRTPNFAGRG